jgi:hypothetical protein
MKILITGGSSGIGLSFAKAFDKEENEIFLVARDEKKLKEAKKQLHTKTNIIIKDLSKLEECISLHDQLKDKNIDILINSAGFGMHGFFLEDDLNKQMEMIDLNIKATQALTKLFLEDMTKRNSGSILNIASTAAFSPGPLMASYFASKAYILRLTEAIYEELKESNSNVYIGCLCPGPVDTHFNDKLGVQFKSAQNSDELVEYAIKMMKKKKLVIIPTTNHKLNSFFNKFVPLKTLLKANYNVQIKKIENKKSSK